MANSHKIGIFDSGVGGLTILSSIAKVLPNADLIFCSDNNNYPYGTKSIDEVTRHTKETAIKLIQNYNLDLLVIACNTASTVALPKLRDKFSIPVVGVVPAIKPAGESTKSKTIGLLATPATAEREYTAELIRDFASHCDVRKVGSSKLVDIAESKLRGEVVDKKEILSEIEPLFVDSDRRLDTVVLGCTHFPLLIEELIDVAPWKVTWIDSGEAIASRVKSLIPANDSPKSTSTTVGVFTAKETAEPLRAALKKYNIHTVEFI